ncbi:MAG: tetratricopeptide repeat protein, partial [Candidatus Binatia bacterium]
MRWNRGIASWLLALLLLSGIAALLILPVLLTTTILPNPSAVTLPELPPPLGPVADALAVQELLETTYLGHGDEVPDPGEPAVVLRKYLEQNAHGYHQLLVEQEQKLDIELIAWQSLTQLYPHSRHALVALAKHYQTKARVSGDISYTRQAADAYVRAADIGLANGRIRYTRELSDLLVGLGDRKGLDDIFGRMLAHPKDTDRDYYYLALVDYADGLARFSDERAWGYFEQAIALHPENNEEAINLYAKSLLDRGHRQKALEVLDTHLTSDQRVNAVVPAFLRKQAMEHAGLDTSTAEAEIALIRQRMVDGGPLAGYSSAASDQASAVVPTTSLDNSVSALFAPGAAFAQIPENPASSVPTMQCTTATSTAPPGKAGKLWAALPWISLRS